MKFRTRAIHVGNERDPQTGAIVPPVHLASTYVQPGAGEWGKFDYGRSGNPTRSNLERTLASLESGEHALAFASGMAATHTVTMLLEAGDEILAGTDIYGGTYRLLHKIINRSGIQVRLVPTTDLEALDRAISPRTKVLWIESPGNPLMSITDIAGCARVAHRHGVLLAVDNTFATPVLTRPLELGADIVMHSATKYLNGHSDIIGGALVTGDAELATRIKFLQNSVGGVMGPFDAFLANRGLKTLGLRMKAHCENALTVARWLEDRAGVDEVIYPGLISHPQHDLAARQMAGGFGGMVSLRLEGDLERTTRVLERVEVFTLAESLGGVESLVNHPAIMTHASLPKEVREAGGIGDTLIRLSVGVEEVEDLIADLDQALG